MVEYYLRICQNSIQTSIDASIDVKGYYHRWEMQISPAEEEFYGGPHHSGVTASKPDKYVPSLSRATTLKPSLSIPRHRFHDRIRL